MTTQCGDEFKLQNEPFGVYAVSGDIFIPEEFMLHPIWMDSSCWRGYQAIYRYHDDVLFLNKLEINLMNDNVDYNAITGPEINGVLPQLKIAQSELDSVPFNNIYEDVNLQLDFTGGIIIVNDLIQEFYNASEFSAHIWAYKKIYELIFKEGKLVEKRDISEKMVEIRNKLTTKSSNSDLNMTRIKTLIQSSLYKNYNILDLM